MSTKIQKWGNSLAVRLPKSVIEETNLEEGSSVGIIRELNQIIIKHIPPKKQTLTELVRKISPSNKHGEESWGIPTGNEIW